MQIKRTVDGTFTVTLTEEELDAIRAPLGRIVGELQPHRQTCSRFYSAAQDALGYRDDVSMYRGFIEAKEARGSR